MCHLLESSIAVLLIGLLYFGFKQHQSTQAFLRHVEKNLREDWLQLGGSAARDPESLPGSQMQFYLLEGRYESINDPVSLQLGRVAERWARIALVSVLCSIFLFIAAFAYSSLVGVRTCWFL
jgi:hypothetical protein